MSASARRLHALGSAPGGCGRLRGQVRPAVRVHFAMGQIDAPADWQPWPSLGKGLIAAVGGYVWLRWEDSHRVRRLAAGDYGRYDLL